VGGGRLGSFLLRGLLRAGFSREEVVVCEREGERARALSRELGVRVVESCEPLLEEAELIFLAVKPADLEGVMREVGGKSEGKVVISCVAGVPLRRLEEGMRGAKIFRLMPNLACAVGQGVMAYSPSSRVGEREKEMVVGLLARLGVPVEVPEERMDAITALSGSGPAYFSLIIGALAEGAAELGIPEDEALRLASQTAKGTGELMLQLGLRPEELVRMVASPGGVTEAALRELKEGKVAEVLKRALRAAHRRAGELG